MSGNRNIMEQLLSKSDPPFLKDSQSENKAIRLSDNSDQHRADDLNSCAKDQEALVTLPMAEHSASDNLTPASNPSNAPSDGSTAALEVLNERWGQGSSTLLHAAACSKHGDIVYALLRIGADPTVRDERGRTPYDAANRKEARNEFRRFMADHPDMHDYTLTHIPSPLTQVQLEEKEKKEAEKRKAQKKAKKQRAKEKKAIDQLKMEEEKKQERLSKLSDREKRARAAEQRFARQQVNSTEVGKISDAQRCAFCSRDLSGRVPFERLSFKYCNTTCVREHRLLLENR
ncbi:predicted protein [Nematostella vectensis]|uniref:Vms1-associating treble clef domain-containing protein n=1 Tax=Nematostella vectensis TaxID=45351 RepID=A7RZZ4_NEMVE|nr:predicted protein [Nematostella vectensis]|eukprot:XP_001634989.1 predicted protein [Nematostella vectensis]